MDGRADQVSVRLLLDEMTSGQPESPPDRYAAIVRRARRNQLTRGAVTAGVAALVAAAAVGIGTSAIWITHPSAHRTLPAWALPWPDHRNGSVPQRVLDGAVTAWRHQFAAEAGVPYYRTRPDRVIWYVGQTVANSQAIAVIFEVDNGVGMRLVAGWAPIGQVLDRQQGWARGSRPWKLFDVPAPPPSPRLRIGINLHGIANRPGPNPDSWIVVLAAPSVWSMTYTWTQAPTACCSGDMGGLSKTRQGLLVADVGQLGSRVRLVLPDAGGVGHPAGYVGLPGNRASQIPYLSAPAAIAGRRGFRPYIDLTGQGSSRTALTGHRGLTTVLVRCYGPHENELTLEVSSSTQAGGVRVPCTDSVYQRLAYEKLAGQRITIRASAITAYRIVFGTVG